MKSSKKLSLISFLLFMFVASQFAMTASSRLVTPQWAPGMALPQSPYQAIIVIRHGKDRESDDKNRDPSKDWESISPKWPIYDTIPNERIPGDPARDKPEEPDYHNSVTVDENVGHRLNDTGELQAKRLQDNLSKILTSANSDQMGPFAPVTRAITIDPSPSGATGNPFATIYPFLKNDPTFNSISNPVDKDGKPVVDKDGNPVVNRNLLLINTKTSKTVSPTSRITFENDTKNYNLIVADGLQEMINADTLLPNDGGSTLLCWDGEGLWGDVKFTYKDGTSRREFNPNSILAQLGGNIVANQFNIPEFYPDFYPAKGAIIYIFTRAIYSNTKYNMTIYSSAWDVGQTSGLGVLTWRGTWNSNHSGWPEVDDRYRAVTTNRVVAGAHQLIVRD
jgi:hypothetical protein